ncbi:MRG/MORF4L binding protein [Brevipalpus obovatus]|uniref:MRG/MORF4L binding protein n=1 Tax=Brevipalpus obovatus TaxID=246614 RepID=UPI003D9E5FED
MSKQPISGNKNPGTSPPPTPTTTTTTAPPQDAKTTIPPWPPEKEIQLLYALKGRRPVGVNRFFQMIFIQEEFSRLTGKDVPSHEIWKYLETLYDIEALNENEEEPYIYEEKEFSLPSDYVKAAKD